MYLGNQITFAQNEEITRISGTFGEHDKVTVIKSLTIATNKNNYPTYGKKGTTEFSLPVAKGKFVGFYGTYEDYLESFGAYLKPIS